MLRLDPLRALGRGFEVAVHRSVDRVTDQLGGPARRRVVVLLACVLSVDAADKGTVAALAFQLEHSLHIGNAAVGLMVTVTSLLGAAATVPFGSMADRFRRTRILWIAVVLWGAAQAASGMASSFVMLLGIRVVLGGVTGVAGPVVTSLTGDYFPPKDRGRMWGFILTGEVLGTGAGILVSGLVSSWLGWRAAFAVLALPSGALAWVLWKWLPEPARGGQSRIAVGDEEIVPVEEVADAAAQVPTAAPAGRSGDEAMRRLVEREHVVPDESIVLDEAPTHMGLWRAVLYILRVRTNLVLILASSLGYFFFSGLSTFAVIFVRGQYRIGQGAASAMIVVVGLGIMAGLLVSGRVTDALVRRGRVHARLVVGTVGFVASVVALVPALLTHSLALALPLFVVAGALVAAPNPGLDAARLDVVPARMWGRAEGVRTALRQTLEAFAPVVFGIVSEAFGGKSQGIATGIDVKHAVVSQAQTQALQYTFLIMVVPVVIGGAVLLLGRSSYLVDIASALESDRRLAQSEAAT